LLGKDMQNNHLESYSSGRCGKFTTAYKQAISTIRKFPGVKRPKPKAGN